MQIHFKGTNYDLPPRVSAHAQKKLEGLKKHLGRNRQDLARAYVDLGKETAAHQTGRIWRADMNLDVEGTRFYAKAVEESIEKAIDVATAELASELHTARRRQQSLMKKGGMAIKSLMRGFQA